MEVVGVELMALGVQFYSCGSIRYPVPSLLVSLGIYVELIQKGLEINFLLDVQNSSLEVLCEVQIIFAVALAYWLSYSFAA